MEIKIHNIIKLEGGFNFFKNRGSKYQTVYNKI